MIIALAGCAFAAAASAVLAGICAAGWYRERRIGSRNAAEAAASLVLRAVIATRPEPPEPGLRRVA
jgi:hypothetical protein